MYAIMIKGENKVIDWVREPEYCRFNKKSNRYVKTKKEKAEGIWADNRRYLLNLPGQNLIEGKQEAVIVDRGDIEPILFRTNNNISELRRNNRTIEDAIVEQNIDIEEKIAVIEDAILELDK